MALEGLIGDVYRTNADVYRTNAETHRANQQLPIQYGNLYNQQFSPYYSFLSQQANNLSNNQGNVGQAGISGATSLGNSSLSLYGQLAGMQQEQQQFNSLAPVLGAVMNQFGGFNMPGIAPIGNPMAGYQDAIGGAYGQLGNFTNNAYAQNSAASNQYNQQFEDVFNRQAAGMPGRAYGGSPHSSVSAPASSYQAPSFGQSAGQAKPIPAPGGQASGGAYGQSGAPQQGAAAPQWNPQWTFGGSKSYYDPSGPRTDYYYNPVIPTNWSGQLPKSFPGRQTVRDY